MAFATELASAFAIKLRIGAMTSSERATAQSLFASLWSEALTVVPVLDTHFRLAATFCATNGVNVRASDALHLAIAKDHELELCTRDKAMALAAMTLGLAVYLVGEASPR